MFLKNLIKRILTGNRWVDISQTQWYSAEQIKSFQEKRLRKMIPYAYNTIPYYRDLFNKHRIKPHHIQTIADLKKIPPLTRKDVVTHYDSLINPSRIANTHLSSATTGQRAKWAYSKIWSDLFGRTLWRGFTWSGLTGEKRVVSLYSRAIGEVVKESLIIREALDLEKIEADLEQIRAFKPHFAYCYSSSAYMTAQYLLKKGIRLPLEGVIVTGDYLYPHYRPVIEEAFQCKVFNNYGCNDGGAWGAECEEQCGFHLDFERCIVEFDEKGKMLATDLWNDAMPFIRYENGDTGRWLEGKCKCGREMPLFSVDGRMSDYIITPTKVFSPTAIDVRNEYLSHIHFVQYDEKRIEIFYLFNPQCNEQEGRAFLNTFVQHFTDMHVTLTESECPFISASLKKRICINKSQQTVESFFS